MTQTTKSELQKNNMSDSLKIALVQADIFWENIDANLSELEEKLWSINQSVDLIILPEMFNSGFTTRTSLAEVPGLKTEKWLKQMASQLKALIGGSYLVNDKGKYYNRFVFAFPDGKIRHYDKRHLFILSQESNNLTTGNNRIVVSYKGWKICPFICYDLRFPKWSLNSFDISTNSYTYDLLIYAASWPADRSTAWNTLLKARAIENQCYTIGVNRIGTDGNDIEYIGQSQVNDFLGVELLSLDANVQIGLVTINKPELSHFRAEYPFLKSSLD